MLSGVGMKAGSKELFVLGRALTTFDGSKYAISNSEVKDSGGRHSVIRRC